MKKKKIKSKQFFFSFFIKNLFILLSHLFYVSSISTIIILTVAFLSTGNLKLFYSIFTPLLFLFISASIIHLYNNFKWSKTFLMSGFYILVPGIIAAIIPVIGENSVIRVANIIGGSLAVKITKNYIDFRIPTANILVYGFLLLGLLLIYISCKCKLKYNQKRKVLRLHAKSIK